MALDHRAGGLAFAAKYDAPARAAAIRQKLRDSFLDGHGGPSCKVCPNRIDIPPEVSDTERERRAKALWDLHWHRMRASRGPRNRKQNVA